MNSLEQVAKAIGILLLATLCVVAFATVLVVALDFVLLIFLAILFSVFLTKTSQLVSRYLPLSYSWSLALVTALLLLIVVGGFTLLGGQIQERVQATSKRLDEGIDKLVQRLQEQPMALKAFKRIPFAQELILDEQPSGAGESNQTQQDASKSAEITTKLAGTSAGKAFTVLGKILSTSLGLVANIGLVVFVGIFIAVEPALYRNGLARLFPLDRRHRVTDILDRMGNTLFSWLMGRFLAMVITGVGMAIALFALGVPLPIAVGVITGLLAFVPNIGAIISLGLGVLMALPQGTTTVIWVVGLYATLQLVESNIITPLVQQHQTSIPPALLLSFQVIMGAVAGFLGLMVATPLLAISLVLVKQAWIEDVLGEPAGES